MAFAETYMVIQKIYFSLRIKLWTFSPKKSPPKDNY